MRLIFEPHSFLFIQNQEQRLGVESLFLVLCSFVQYEDIIVA